MAFNYTMRNVKLPLLILRFEDLFTTWHSSFMPLFQVAVPTATTTYWCEVFKLDNIVKFNKKQHIIEVWYFFINS